VQDEENYDDKMDEDNLIHTDLEPSLKKRRKPNQKTFLVKLDEFEAKM
jgi:hypothetical protein